MIKKPINQNDTYALELLNAIEYEYIFENTPLNRLKNNTTPKKKESKNKQEDLNNLKIEINSIENCKLKEMSKKIVLGNGNIESSIMIVGEAPGLEEEQSGKVFLGEVGELLRKMLMGINIKKEQIYMTYAVNFRPPEDRKPSSLEIKRYSAFLQKHISIINPKIIILMGSTAMESLTGLNNKISIERGKWKEVIVGNTNYNVIITFSPSYLLRSPENKKFSWDDLKKIKKKIIDLGLNI